MAVAKSSKGAGALERRRLGQLYLALAWAFEARLVLGLLLVGCLTAR
jgi:hypothetical protein